MKPHSILKFTTLAAACLLALSTTAYAAHNGGRNGNGGNNGNKNHGRDSSFIWKDHENGCAVGNTPPPGANCTNREDR